MASFFSDDDDDDEDEDEGAGAAEAPARPGAAAQPARAEPPARPQAQLPKAQPAPALRQPGKPPPRADSKSVTIFSDDESSADDTGAGQVQSLLRSNTELRRQSTELRQEVDTWKGQANLLGGQIEDLQERLEESEQSWSHEQRRRKSQWEDQRACLENENVQLQRRLREWVPMQHEDERSHLLREVLETVSRTRQALQNQGSELVSYSEQITEENRKLEDRARAQAVCLEQQQNSAERLCAELQQLGSEARVLREAEQRAQAEAAAFESQASADVSNELQCLHEELQCASARRELDLQKQFDKAEAECGALAQRLHEESDSARLELQAMDLLLREKTKCHDLESTCQRLEDALSESRGAQGQHDHLESSCLRLQEELLGCRKAELSELGLLEERFAEHRSSSAGERRSLEERCRRLEEELLQCRHSEGSHSRRLESTYQQLQETRQELDKVAEGRRLERLEFQRLQAERAAEAERRPEQRLRELEARCEASEQEVRRLRGQLGERSVEGRQAPELQEHSIGLSEAQLAAELKRRQACRAWLSSLKAAHVESVLPLAPGVSSLSYADRERLQVILANALSSYEVEPSDVEVTSLKDYVRCVVNIRGCRSVQAVSDALTRTLRRAEGFGGAAPQLAALCVLPKARVTPKWPLERLQAEIEFEYGYMLTLSQLEKLVPIVAESYALYHRSCENTRSQAVDALEALEGHSSTFSFGGKLISIAEGRRRHLLEDSLEQGAVRLADLINDAAKAQLSVKARFAPDTLWARSDLSDLEKVPPDHSLRLWKLARGTEDPVSNSLLYDPGISSEDHLLQQARSQRTPLDEDPSVGRLANISRLEIVFESIEGLGQTIDWISSRFDVLWVDNRFWNPPCLGLRDVRIGVQQNVSATDAASSLQRLHISELQLVVKEMRDVHLGAGHRLYEQMSGTLLQCGVRQKDVHGVRSIALRVLDTTAGQAAHEAVRDLHRTVSALELHAGSMTEATALLASELRQEARAQAVAAGVSQEKITRIEAAALASARRADARQEGRRRNKEADVLRQRPVEGSSGVAEEHLRQQVSELQHRCGDLEASRSAQKVENEWLKAEVRRLTLQAEAAAHVPCSEEPRSPPSEQPRSPAARSWPGRSTTDRRHLASLAQNSAAAVAKLLKEVRSLDDAQAVLLGGGCPGRPSAEARLSALQELERQTCWLENTNHEWASAVANRPLGASPACETPGDLSDSSPHCGASPDGCGRVAGSGLKDGMSPAERRTALTSALQCTARRLEGLRGRLGDLGAGERDFRAS